MPERTVQLGSMFYYDEDGRGRRGNCGDKIQVSSDFVKKFDALNVLPGESGFVEPESAAPEAVEAEARPVPNPPKPGPARKTAK